MARPDRQILSVRVSVGDHRVNEMQARRAESLYAEKYFYIRLENYRSRNEINTLYGSSTLKDKQNTKQICISYLVLKVETKG